HGASPTACRGREQGPREGRRGLREGGAAARARSARATSSPVWVRALLDRHAPVDAVLLGGIGARGLVIRAAVVPDHDVALTPLMAVLPRGLDHVAGELVDERVALRRLEPLAPENLARIEVHRLTSRLRPLAADRLAH